MVDEKGLVTYENKTAANIMLDKDMFEQGWRAAKAFASSDMVPAHFRGRPENCFLAFHMAANLDVDPFMLMQNLYLVHGKPGLEGKLVIALINQRGPYPDGVQFEINGRGDDLSVTAVGVRRNGRKDTATVGVAMAKQMGWWSKKDSLWPKMPEQFCCYRSATFLARRHCPEVLMGLQTREELVDAYGPETVVVVKESDELNKQLGIEVSNAKEQTCTADSAADVYSAGERNETLDNDNSA